MNPYNIVLQRHRDDRGILTACDNLPFEVKRTFWITEPRGIRGAHAHKECWQAIIVPQGSCFVHLNNDYPYTLERSDFVLVVPPGNKITLSTFAPNTVILVLCSHPYDESDYIYEG